MIEEKDSNYIYVIKTRSNNKDSVSLFPDPDSLIVCATKISAREQLYRDYMATKKTVQKKYDNVLYIYTPERYAVYSKNREFFEYSAIKAYPIINSEQNNDNASLEEYSPDFDDLDDALDALDETEPMNF